MRIARDRILTYIRQEATRPLKPRELARALRIPENEYRTFRRLLKGLEREGAVVRLRHNRVGPPEQVNQTVGRLSVNPSGFGFVTREGGGPDVFIGADALKTAMHGDKVTVRVTSRAGRGGQPEGEIVRVLERAVRSVVGIYRTSGRHGSVEPDDARLTRNITVSHEDNVEAQPGQRVVARIDSWPAGRLPPEGRIVEVLGHADDPRTDIPAIIREFDLPFEFPPQVCAAAAAILQEIDQEEIGRREDLRGLPCITIDPVGARDHDDAVSLQVGDSGEYLLGVHIADVSHFVPEDSLLDHEAMARGTSVYLPDRVLPMLPEALSAGICSIRPEQDRLTVSVLFRIGPDGEVLDNRVSEAVICSQAHFTYEQAQQILDGGAAERQPHADMLRAMDRLRQTLSKRMKRRGAIDLELPEPRVLLDEAGHTASIEIPRRLDSHRLIETFMLMANEAVARRMADCGIPLLYRVHDRPDADRLGAYARLAGAFGHRFPKVESISPIGIQGFLEGLQGEPTQRVLSSQLLRSMRKAVYTPENIGHFGLACPCYTHFTSPIRRYPDLLVHRLLKESLSGPITGARRAHLDKHLPAVGDRATQCEITAKEAEWGALKSKQIRYLEQRIGEPFRATIVKVSSSGFFCELDKVLVDGFVRVSSLTDDYYSHVEDRGAIVGKHTGRTFTLGDSVQVRLAAADSRRRRIDLLVEEGGTTARRDRIEKVPKVRKKRKYHPSRKRRSPGRR